MMNDIVRNEIASYAKNNYSIDKMLSEYYGLYDRITKNKRILVIDVNYKFSSTGQIVYNIYSNAEKYGKDVAVCYGRGANSQDKNVFKFGVDCETFVHAGLSRLTGYNGCFSFFSTRRLVAFIKKFKPDIIHIHELHAYFVNIKPLIDYIKKSKISLVWTFHCEYMYTGKCGHAYECRNFQNGCGNCPAVRDYPKSLFFDKTAQMFRQKEKLLRDLDFTIVTPSKWLERRVEMSFLNNKHVMTIFNGVDTKVFYPRNPEKIRNDLNIEQDTKVVLFVASNLFDENKGWKWVQKLALMLNDEKMVFLLVGQGDVEGDYPDNMKFVGGIDDKNTLAAFYSLADVFLLCSKRETYSLTCAEALCCGTPVVGFESGAPETVFKGAYALFVPYGDIKKMKELLLQTIKKYET